MFPALAACETQSHANSVSALSPALLRPEICSRVGPRRRRESAS